LNYETFITALQQPEKIICIQAPVGTGKTTAVKKYIAENPTQKYIIIVPSVSLAEELHRQLKDLGFVLYKD